MKFSLNYKSYFALKCIHLYYIHTTSKLVFVKWCRWMLNAPQVSDAAGICSMNNKRWICRKIFNEWWNSDAMNVTFSITNVSVFSPSFERSLPHNHHTFTIFNFLTSTDSKHSTMSVFSCEFQRFCHINQPKKRLFCEEMAQIIHRICSMNGSRKFDER